MKRPSSDKCKKCGASDFGTYGSATTGKVTRYCRACRRVRARDYGARRARSDRHHTKAQWEALLAQHDRCPICHRAWADVPPRPDRRYKNVWTRDHIVPLSQGGADTIENIQPACYQCNSGKCDGRPVRVRST